MKMVKESKAKKTEKPSEQIDRFQEEARALGCDESEAVFDAKLAEIAKHKPTQEQKTEKK